MECRNLLINGKKNQLSLDRSAKTQMVHYRENEIQERQTRSSLRVVILVGKNEKESMQILHELTVLCEKYTADQKDVLIVEDYTQANL